ncbi:hypothetical protein JADG_000226 [Aureobasidium aubasidani]|nr:hypothetical protein JADG_000225 [Aureobasidium pullulans]KAG2160487.1 hypothetical protein JADG_000226 [Aureobasidium pullulans]
MEMELYQPSDDVTSRYPTQSRVHQTQFAAIRPRPEVLEIDIYAWYKKICEEGVITGKERDDWAKKEASDMLAIPIPIRSAKVARTS